MSQHQSTGVGAAEPTHARLREIAQEHLELEGPLLPILHAVQAEFGHIPADAARVLAEVLNLSRAEVHGVITFYHDLRQRPRGRHVIRLCRSEACQSVGAVQLADEVMARLGLGWDETASDGSVTLEPVYCLGLCACGPSAEVDGRLIGRANADRVLAEAGARS